jgi:hypothetical protein
MIKSKAQFRIAAADVGSIASRFYARSSIKKTQITGEAAAVAAFLVFHTPFSVCRHVLSPVFVEHWMGFEITNRPPSSTVILHLLLLLFPQLLPMATAFASFTSVASHSSSCLITTRRRVPVRVWDPQVQ